MWPAVVGAALAQVPEDGLAPVHPDGPPGLALDAASCATCHEAEAAEWSTSRHAVAGTNTLFWEAWTRWPNGWCVNCHAPLASGQVATLGREAVPGTFVAPAEPTGAWLEGVTCAVCHVEEGAILTRNAPTNAGKDAHPLRQDPHLGSPERCGACHEFPFQVRSDPGEAWTFGAGLSQETVSEWRSSGAALEGMTCTGCHMGSEGHRFPGAHDEDLVRDLVQVDVVRDGPAATFTLSAPGAAHRVPTGDLFRRLVLETCADGTCSSVVDSTTLRRVFRPSADHSWELALDTTLQPEAPGQTSERVLTLDARGARAWRLVYRLSDPAHDAALPATDRAYVVHEGPLPAHRPR